MTVRDIGELRLRELLRLLALPARLVPHILRPPRRATNERRRIPRNNGWDHIVPRPVVAWERRENWLIYWVVRRPCG